MKVVVVTVLILVVFFVGGIFINNYIDSSAEELASIINKLDDAIEKEDWEAAEEYMKEFTNLWDSTKNKWQTFLEHYEIDIIDIALAKVVRYVDIKESTLALGQTSELQLLIKHIADKKDFKLHNIL
ncbi:MAG: DUF4363 family protein [Clostridiaceae bacterium]|nr:DUF4363 family protein [Clostridiaceae bacterium]